MDKKTQKKMHDEILGYDAEKCAVKLKEFLDKFFPAPSIDLQLKMLSDFRVSWLYYRDYYIDSQNYTYGMLYKSDELDEDATVLMNMIYLVVYHDKLPNLKFLGDIDGIKYRGETINTFNNLFQDNLLGVKEFVPFTEKNKDFYFKILQFREKYLTMGNFMLLPNDGEVINGRKQSLNILKQELCRDYADIFLSKLYNNEKRIEKTKKMEYNVNYFDTINDLKTFCNINFLNDYIDDNDNPKNVFEHTDPNKPYVWYKHISDYSYMKKVSKEDYKNFALNYIDRSTLIIQKRAELICRELKKKFTDFGII